MWSSFKKDKVCNSAFAGIEQACFLDSRGIERGETPHLLRGLYPKGRIILERVSFACSCPEVSGSCCLYTEAVIFCSSPGPTFQDRQSPAQGKCAHCCLLASGDYEGSLPHCGADGGGHGLWKGRKAPLSTSVLLTVSPSSTINLYMSFWAPAREQKDQVGCSRACLVGASSSRLWVTFVLRKVALAP